MDVTQETYQGYLISGLPYPYSWALNMLQEENSLDEIAKELGRSKQNTLHIINLGLEFLNDIRDKEKESLSYRQLLNEF